MNPWKKERGVNSTQVLHSVYEVSDEFSRQSNIDEIEIKYEFAKVFARELVEKNLIEIQKSQDPYRLNTKYEAQLTVAEPGITAVEVDTYFYEVQGHRFTHKDIEKAVLDAWPEKFL